MSLDQLRHEIDAIDTQLVELLAKRQSVTTKVGEYKKQVGKAIYDPEREASLINKRREMAESISLNPDLIEDLLRRIMRESYQSQHNSYRCLKPDANVVIVGGAGALGRRFVDMFERSGYQTTVFEKDDWHTADAVFKEASLVIIADLTSLKGEPLNHMLTAHEGPVVGLHPMFGPDVPNFVKQVIVVCHGRNPLDYQWLIDQLALWGAMLEVDYAQQHDKSMELIQAMRHFTTYVYGRFLAKQNPELEQLLRLSSPIYRLELAMTGRLFAQNSHLYADIIYNAKDIKQLSADFMSELQQAINDLNTDDKEAFKVAFDDVADWFGDKSQSFLAESRTMLKTAHDAKSFINK